MSHSEIVDHYLDKLQEPGFEIDQVRKELETQQVPEEDIRTIVRLVDDELQQRAMEGTTKGHSKEVVVAGIILAMVGLGITAGTVLGWIPSGNSVVIVYGPFFAGLAVIFTGLAMRNRESRSNERISRSIKRPL